VEFTVTVEVVLPAQALVADGEVKLVTFGKAFIVTAFAVELAEVQVFPSVTVYVILVEPALTGVLFLCFP